MQKICLFCSSKQTYEDSFIKNLAREFKIKNWDMVYGGAKVGAMGQLADIFLSEGVNVYGVIPRNLFSSEVPHQGLTELIEVDDLMERKKLLMKLSNAFVVLPGGLGTLDEAVEVLTWKSLGLPFGPLVFFNPNNYWKAFFDLLNDLKSKGMLYDNLQDEYSIANSFDELIREIAR
jgi:uncharacterized protein (TIGR00730 family)